MLLALSATLTYEAHPVLPKKLRTGPPSALYSCKRRRPPVVLVLFPSPLDVRLVLPPATTLVAPPTVTLLVQSPALYIFETGLPYNHLFITCTFQLHNLPSPRTMMRQMQPLICLLHARRGRSGIVIRLSNFCPACIVAIAAVPSLTALIMLAWASYMDHLLYSLQAIFR